MRILTAASVALLAAACAKKSDVAQQKTDSTLASTAAASGTEAAIKPSETAVAPEVNPPGDIPDSQQFVSYANSAGGYKLGLFPRGDQLEVVQPVYRRRDPNCCPTGGYDRVLYRFDGRQLVVTRRWHTRLFKGP